MDRRARIESDARSECDLSSRDDRFRAIFNAVNDGIFISCPATGHFVEVNEPACRMFGYPRAELIGRDVNTLSSGVHPHTEAMAIALNERARLGRPQIFEWQCKRRDGSLFWTEMSLRYSEFGRTKAMVAIVRDIAERKRADSQIVFMARHDALTGLVNRSTFVDALDQAIARSQRFAGQCAVLCIDLDRFKDVNDTRGHRVGNRLLQLVADRLRAEVRACDNVARFGGDEFAILMDDVRASTETEALAEGVIASIAKPFSIDDSDIYVSASIGIATYGEGALRADTLLSQADIALYRAKAAGRDTYRFFSRAMNDEVTERVRLTDELRIALKDEQLFLVYQPQVKADNGRIIGVEALVRWRHPTRGVLGPAEFIPVAEGSGLIVPLGEWVLREACRQGRSWIEIGIEPGTIAVNLSAVQLKAPLELERTVLAVLAETGFPPSSLELEITETAMINMSSQHEEVVRRLRYAGVRFSLDDFGTGYSSLNHLRRLPVDRIKIARDFIAELTTSVRAAAVVKLVLGLSHDCGSEVIAEGVETPAQLNLLLNLGCTDVQGYYFAAPMPAAAIEQILRVGTILPAKAPASTVAA
jgi:diguanylate cyclase (GGDEF)-like protein/PAS domain S-box-containing protein